MCLLPLTLRARLKLFANFAGSWTFGTGARNVPAAATTPGAKLLSHVLTKCGFDVEADGNLGLEPREKAHLVAD